MHHTVTEATCHLSDIVSMTSGLHHFEESDQLVLGPLLNAFDVMHKNSNTTRVFLSVGTNIFFLSPLPLFMKTKKRISIYECY